MRSVQGSSKRIRFVRSVTLEPDLARQFAAERGLAVGTSYDDVLADGGIDAVVLRSRAAPMTLMAEKVMPTVNAAIGGREARAAE